jgi:hypothetical protein
VANVGTRIAALTDELAPQGFQSAFKLLPVLVDDVPVHDRFSVEHYGVRVEVRHEVACVIVLPEVRCVSCAPRESAALALGCVVMKLRTCGSQLS